MTQLQPARLAKDAPQKQLHPHRLTLNEHASNTWVVRPEHETPFDAVRDPAYWAHVSAKLRAGDIIRVIAEDMSYFGELLVIDAGRLFAKVHTLRFDEIKPQQIFNVAIPEGFRIKFQGPQKKFAVIRGNDVLVDGKTKAEAEQWLSEHVKATSK